jgi:hypothetical protein
MMKRTLVVLTLAGTTIGVAALGSAQAAQAPVVPVRGGTACKTRPPVLLTAGRSPHAPLRFDLASMAGRSQSLVAIETADLRTRAPGGTWRPSTTANTLVVVLKAGQPANGRLPMTTRMRATGSSYPKPVKATVKGYTDLLGGGRTAGGRDDDHFPRESVGVGATWRVVNCDEVAGTPARETRTYPLRSVHDGTAQVTFRDVVSLDAAHLALGSETIGGEVVTLRLMSLRGTATGSSAIQFAGGFSQTSQSVTRLHVSLVARSPSTPKMVIRTEVVDTSSLLPSS